MSKQESFNLVNRERLARIQSEVQYIRKEYGLNNLTLNSLAKYANTSRVYRDNNLTKTANFIKEVLLCYGYSSEEITRFMERYKVMFNSNYGDFRYRLALMHHFGVFEHVFFYHQYVLINEFTKEFFSTKDLFSIMHSNDVSKIPNIEENIISVKKEQLEQMRNSFPFDMETLKKYDSDMIRFLKEKKIQNVVKKGL